MEQEYNIAKEQYNNTLRDETRYQTFLNTLNEMKVIGFTTDPLINQVQAVFEINNNLKNDSKAILDKYEKDVHEFSVCILVSDDKKVWIARRNNILKEYYGKYQATGGHKEKDESFETCAIREAKEETGIEIKDIKFICLHEGFKKYIDEVECMYRCAIFYSSIQDQIPQRTEPEKNDDWIKVEIKDLYSYELTNSFTIRLDEIVAKLNEIKKVVKKSNSKKRKNEDGLPNGITSPE